MIRAVALGVLLLAGGTVGAAGQDRIRVRGATSGPGPQVLAQALASPHDVIPPGQTRVLLARDTAYQRTIIVLGREVVVEGTIHGDVIVIGGDLYMHPGGDISGRAIAIGGGVYESALARVGGEARAYRDFTYDIAPMPGGWTLTYRSIVDESQAIAFQGLYGAQVPTYDRSDGLSLAVAPSFGLPRTRIRVEPRITYRSQLGRLDPSIAIVDSLGAQTALHASMGRSTFTNDSWIWSDLINSLESLWDGDDTRNYNRASRGEVTLARRWPFATGTFEPYVGGRFESATSVRPGLGATSQPWSFLARGDTDDMLRPNPTITPGKATSALFGAQLEWTAGDITAHLRLDQELGSFAEECGACDPRIKTNFAQTTIDGTIRFPTFGTQRLRVDGHAILSGSTHGTPIQRWAYVGGPGSIPTIDMLSRGGDRLIYVDARYDIPLDSVAIPFAGPPIVTLREVIGGADVGRFPSLAQAAGVRLSAGYVYGEWLVDPVSRHTHFSVGLAIGR